MKKNNKMFRFKDQKQKSLNKIQNFNQDFRFKKDLLSILICKMIIKRIKIVKILLKIFQKKLGKQIKIN